MNLIDIENLGILVSKRNKDHALVSKEWNTTQVDSLLATSLGTDTCKGPRSFANECSTHPQGSSGIHEILHLSRKSSVATTETEHESVVFLHLFSCDDGVIWFGRSMHLFQDFFTQCFWNLKNVTGSTSFTNSLGDCLGKFGDVTIERVG